MHHFRTLLPLIGAIAFLLWALPVAPQPAAGESAAPALTAQSKQEGTDGSAPQAPPGFWDRANLLGDMGGLRTFLGKYGISLGITETSEVLGNVTGGLHRGAAYDGLTTLTLSLDTAKALQWPGGTFNVSALQIHGRSLSADHLASLQTASNIEADRATRLWELWFQQSVWDGKADVRLGQQSVDQEFLVNQYAAVFLNAAMGWPSLPSADLYAGGPAYPLSSLGVRLRVRPTESLTLLGGVFDDNPPGGPFKDDSQLRGSEASGTRFNLGTGALVLAELQYAVHQSGTEKTDCDTLLCGLPGMYKLGGWYDTARFPDQRFDTTGLSLANPTSSGTPRQHRSNLSLYGSADQLVWRQPGGPQSVGVFLRVMGAPADRNLIDWGLTAGLNVKGLLPGRGDDSFGIGYGWVHVSGRASDLDRDTNFFSGVAHPIRSSEHFIEVTYQWQIAPWWIVQPDIQYIFNPGGGLSNPLNPTERIGNELVLGLRTTITF